MKERNMKKYIIIPILVFIAVLSAQLFWLSISDERYLIKREKWNGERYVGWDMPCNYVNGSTKDEQTYLDCGNGLVYKKIGISPSTTYFNPNDTKLNKEY